jgi:hypothetical protein
MGWARGTHGYAILVNLVEGGKLLKWVLNEYGLGE